MKREWEFSDNVGFSLLWKHAGLFSFWIGDTTYHFGVQRRFWRWGRYNDYETGCSHMLSFWGIGPLFLAATMY